MVEALVERDTQLAELTAAARDASGQVVLLEGEAGAGKTALIRAFRDTLDHRQRFRMGRCDPLSTPAPLGPLYEMLPSFPSEVRELLAAGSDRQRLFAAVSDELTSERSITVIEDAHFAGDATVDLIRYLGRRIQDSPSLLVCAYRPGAVDRTHPLRGALGELGNGALRIELPMLTVAGVTALAQGIDVDPLELYSVTGGNPLFVRQMLAHPGNDLPTSLADAVVGLAQTLPDRAWELLDVVALSPDGLSLDVVERLGREMEIDRAVSVGLLEIEEGRVRCRHDLIRRALEAVIPPARRFQTHRALLAVLDEGSVNAVDLASLAYHAVEAGVPDRAATLSLQAARSAAGDGSHREAVAHYANALRYADHLEADDRLAVLAASSYELYLTGRLEESWDQAVQVLKSARTETERGRALRWMSRLAWFRGKRDDALAHGREAVAVLETEESDAHELAFAYSNLSQLATLDQEPEDARHWGSKALDVARANNDVEVTAHALNNIGTVGMWRGEEGRRTLEKSLELSLTHGLAEHAARAFTNLSYSLFWSGQVDQASTYLRRGLEYCEGSDLATWWWYMRGTRSRLLVTSGQWEAAQAEAEAILASQSVLLLRHDALVALARLRLRQGAPAASGDVMAALEAGRRIDEYWRLVLSASVATEALWMGVPLPQWADGWIAEVLDEAIRRGDLWGATEIGFWQARRRQPVPQGDYARPLLLEWEADLVSAAEAWAEAGFVLEAAISAALSDEDEPVRQAFHRMQDLGALGSLSAVRAEMRAAGMTVVPRGPNRQTTSNPAGLTSRQMEVLECMKDGVTNAEIAAALYITPKTVEHHVSAVLSKLGARTRGEAVAIARERAILD